MEGGTDVVINGNPLPQRNGPQLPIQQNAGNGDAKKASLMRGNNRGARGGVGGNRFGGRGNMGGRQNNNTNRNHSQNKQNDQNDGNGNSGKGEDNRRSSGVGGGTGGGGRKNESYSQDFMISQKMKCLNGPTHELQSIESEEIKFSGRNRLYIGNLTNDVSEEELTELFKPYGEISESFINKDKNFAFLKVDYHVNAERAKRELDGSMRKNRPIRIRFAPNATTIRVKNLTSYVTNELLFKAFEVFGPVERAVIIVDDRGKTTGEGIVEYARKSGAMTALRYCSEKCFFLTSSLRPSVVEPFEHIDDTDGYSEKSLNKKNPDFFKNRQSGPRFAEVGSFEHEYGTRWKQLHELYKQKHEALKREMQMEEEKLEAQMEYARYEHETELLREQLRSREQDRDRQKIEWEMKERQAEEQRTREEEQMRRQQEDMQLRMHRQEEELRRRQQENTLFMQAQQLSSLLDQQEINQGGRNNRNDSGDRRGNGGNGNYDNMINQGGGMGNNQDTGYMDYEHGQNNRPSRFDEQGGQNQGGQGGGQGNGGPRGGGNRGHWNDRRGGGGGDDFQNKRRRF